VLYIGTAGGLEASIVARAGVAFCAVQAAGLRGLSPWRKLVNGLELCRGSIQAWRALRAFQPDAVLATGGYASAPTVIAAWLRRCPVLIYLPDILPGLAVRSLSHLANRVAVSFDKSLDYFAPDKAVVTGYPVRSALYTGNKEAAKERLGLASNWKTLLVLGGSRGAHSINSAVNEALEHLLDLAQVVHIAGQADVAWLRERRERLPPDSRRRYRLHAYLHEEMVDALQAADLAVARAGAATMGEFAAVGLPSVLVPYPYAGQHQEANAEFMDSRGAAVKVRNGALAEGALGHIVEKMLADQDALRSMAVSARKLARPDAARAVAEQLALLSGGFGWGPD
jgi:UDP-N-acetylglucosamine--N-acetylmuramyl-(pentapeptide) pyrophosphoryl-undecaprenol N-acetylglucosamine transferase